jgi:tetratricopeptide (TPR) repeat protein
MSEDPRLREDDIFEGTARPPGALNDALLDGLEDDPRLGSGIPAQQRLTEDDFVNLSGITRPKSDAPRREQKTAAESEPELAPAQAGPVDDFRYPSFAEPGIEDVDPDETELLMPEETPGEEAVPSPVDAPEVIAPPEAVEASEADAALLLEEVDSPAQVLEEVTDDSVPEAQDAPGAVDIAEPAETFESLLEEASAPSAATPGTSGKRFNLEVAEKLLQELSGQPREASPEDFAAGDAEEAASLAEAEAEAQEIYREQHGLLPEPYQPESAALPLDPDLAALMDELDPPVQVDAPHPEAPAPPVEEPAEEPAPAAPVEEPEPEPEPFIALAEPEPAASFAPEEVLDAAPGALVENTAPRDEAEPITETDVLPIAPSIVNVAPAVPLTPVTPQPLPVMERLAEAAAARSTPPPPVIPSITAAPRIDSLAPLPPDAAPGDIPVAAVGDDAIPDAAPHSGWEAVNPRHDPEHDAEAHPGRRHSNRHDRRRRRMAMRAAAVLMLTSLGALGYVAYREFVAPAMRSPEEIYRDAQRLQAQGQYAEASVLFERFARQAADHPNRPEAQFEAALAMRLAPAVMADDSRAAAIRAKGLFEQFIRDNPAHKHLPRAKSLLGILYYETGEYEKAIPQLRELAEDLDDPLAALPVLRALARAYGKSNALHEAEATYLQAAALPKNYTPDHDYFELGELFALRGETEIDPAMREQHIAHAMHYFERAMESPGLDPDTRNGIEQRMMVLGRTPAEVVALSQAGTQAPAPATAPVAPMVEVTPAPVIEAPAEPAPPQEPDPVLEAEQMKQGAPH